MWDRAFFGVKPELIIKSGFIVRAMMGESNASIPTPELKKYRAMFGSYGKLPQVLGVIFSSKVASTTLKHKLGIGKEVVAVKNTRNIGKKDMKLNDLVANIEIDPESYDVRVDGVLLNSTFVKSVAMARLYNLF